MRTARWTLAAILTPFLALAGQGPPPVASVVAARAQAVHLDVSRATKVAVGRRVATLTPVAEADLPPDSKALGMGAVVGVLAVTGSDGKLPAGQYNVFVTRSANGWEAALERDGKIATVSRAVTVASYPIEHGIPKPMISASDSTAGVDHSEGAQLSFASYHPGGPANVAHMAKVTITISGKGWKVTLSFDL